MPRGKQTFKQKDVTRALKAAQEAGLDVHGFEIEPKTGNLRITTKRPDEPGPEKPRNEWDDV
jgi:hypothetical protein